MLKQQSKCINYIKVIICHAVLIMSFKNCLKLSDCDSRSEIWNLHFNLATMSRFILGSWNICNHYITWHIVDKGAGATVFMIVNPVNIQHFSSLTSVLNFNILNSTSFHWTWTLNVFWKLIGTIIQKWLSQSPSH